MGAVRNSADRFGLTATEAAVSYPGEMDYFENADERRKEWHRYYSEKRITHQWFQVHLLESLDIESVLEIGPGYGLVTAMMENAGYRVTTLDRLPPQFREPSGGHRRLELKDATPEDLSGCDCLVCCETLEHLLWEDVDAILDKFRKSGAKHVLISVPYMGFQIDWRLYLNARRWRHAFSFKKLKFLKRFDFDVENDPWGHKWEVGYRDRSLADLEAKLHHAGFVIARRDFTSPCRSVFYLLDNPS